MYKLRPRQLDALTASKERFQQGITRQLIVLPTGGGKTVVFAAIPPFFNFKKRMLVLAHREELVDQAVDKLRKWNPTLKVGKEMAATYSKPSDDVVVASVPTIGRAGSRRIAVFRPSEFDAVVTDEAHHSTASTYKNIYRHFGLMDDGNKILHIGVTATPNRADGQGMGQVFDQIVYQCSIWDFVKEGWLSMPRGDTLRTTANLDKVRTLAGDFAQDELATAVNTYDRNYLIAREWLKYGKERQTIVFAVDIAHAQRLAEAFKSFGVAAEAVWGDNPWRKQKLQAHRDGGLRVLVNCGVLTEGYDDWRVSCMVLARPTKSQLLFVQMVGRGLRLQDGIDNIISAREAGASLEKEDCLLLDVADNTTRHSLVTLPTIFGLPPKLNLKGKSVADAIEVVADAAKDNPDVDFDKLQDIEGIKAYIEHVELFENKWAPEVTANSKLRWHKVGAKYYTLMLPAYDHISIWSNLLDTWTVTGNVGTNKIRQDGLISLPEAFRYAEDVLSVMAKQLLATMRRDYKFKKLSGDQASMFQKDMMDSYKFKYDPNITRDEAAKVINALIDGSWRA